jgi:hypothetical protein
MRLLLDPLGQAVTFLAPLQKQGCKAPRGECGWQRKSKLSNFQVDQFKSPGSLHAPPKKRGSKEDAKAASAQFEECENDSKNAVDQSSDFDTVHGPPQSGQSAEKLMWLLR